MISVSGEKIDLPPKKGKKIQKKEAIQILHNQLHSKPFSLNEISFQIKLGPNPVSQIPTTATSYRSTKTYSISDKENPLII